MKWSSLCLLGIASSTRLTKVERSDAPVASLLQTKWGVPYETPPAEFDSGAKRLYFMYPSLELKDGPKDEGDGGDAVFLQSGATICTSAGECHTVGEAPPKRPETMHSIHKHGVQRGSVRKHASLLQYDPNFLPQGVIDAVRHDQARHKPIKKANKL